VLADLLADASFSFLGSGFGVLKIPKLLVVGLGPPESPPGGCLWLLFNGNDLSFRFLDLAVIYLESIFFKAIKRDVMIHPLLTF
jgi:hypothetical protein